MLFNAPFGRYVKNQRVKHCYKKIRCNNKSEEKATLFFSETDVTRIFHHSINARSMQK